MVSVRAWLRITNSQRGYGSLGVLGELGEITYATDILCCSEGYGEHERDSCVDEAHCEDDVGFFVFVDALRDREEEGEWMIH